MLKKTITYSDFDGNTRTEVLHFNLTQTEALEIALDLPDDVTASAKDLESVDMNEAGIKFVDKLGSKGTFEFIKQLILKSYGIKSADGRKFEKSAAIRDDFAQTLAFDQLFMELMQNDLAASEFVNGVLPASLAEKVAKVNTGGNLIAPVKVQ